MPTQTHRHVAADAEAGRLDRLVQRLLNGSRARARALIENGCVLLNGTPCENDFTKVSGGDVIEIQIDPARRYRHEPRRRSSSVFKLVFEDKHLLVVDKAAHVLTVPTERGEDRTLSTAVADYVGRSRSNAPHIEIVHRLDRGVSGLLVLARTHGVAESLRRQFIAHKPQRRYIAIVTGDVKNTEGTFQSYLTTSRNLTRYSTNDPDAGELAITHYSVVQRLRGATLVEVRLETGRRNQIRVHFAEAGHPVIGDPRYEPAAAHHKCWSARRIALHAAGLAFDHPVTGLFMQFESPLPGEFENFIRKTAMRSTSDNHAAQCWGDGTSRTAPSPITKSRSAN